MPSAQYEQLSDSVLAWKRRQKIGRFDPNTKPQSEIVAERRAKDEAEIRRKIIAPGNRCRVGAEDTRRGTIRFVGPVEALGGDAEAGCRWVGIELDEPSGRNDGSVRVKTGASTLEIRRLFECKPNHGVLVRPEKVETGQWPPLDDLELAEDMEEI